MANAHLRENTQVFQALFLREQVAAELRSGFQKMFDVFLQLDEIGVNGRRSAMTWRSVTDAPTAAATLPSTAPPRRYNSFRRCKRRSF